MFLPLCRVCWPNYCTNARLIKTGKTILVYHVLRFGPGLLAKLPYQMRKKDGKNPQNGSFFTVFFAGVRVGTP